ncbi:putative allergen Asp F7 [Rosellinia necatrix]|uniref:Putative allergen Asp F7 n=1 Tax=Rosellinia necatrix TaxID=77044 RepID=A0A1S7UII7_ROSNE|nr:putative allergen Asp F7 [Rosellinia necatrix]
MKSVSVAAAAALLAGVSVAQPHGHHGHHHLHAKRDLVTEWVTEWETVTVVIDESTTQTLYPTHTDSGAPGEFFQPPTTTAEPEPTVVETTSVQAPPTTTSLPPPPPPPAPTTTSTPQPQPTPEPQPEPEPAPEPEPTTVQAPPPPPVETPSTPSPNSGSSYAGSDAFGTSSMDKAKYSGDITYYDLGLGACGYDDGGSTQHIVALSHVDWYNRGSGTSLGINMPNHAWCDRTITITAGGKSTTALVHDICPGCESGSIDVSESVFEALFGGLGAGRETASWSFN